MYKKNFNLNDLRLMDEVITILSNVTGEPISSVIASLDDVHGMFTGVQINQLYSMYGILEEEES